MTTDQQATTGSDAGTIARDWYDGASQNADHEGIVDWFRTVTNCLELTIHHDDLSVHAAGWLSQDAIDDACRRIDEGI